jgi:hypothetical protein
MRTSSELPANPESVLRRLLVAEVYEQTDPEFGPLRTSSGIEGCLRCRAAMDALVLFRQPPTAAVLAVAACVTQDLPVVAATEDDELIVGLCSGCLGEFHNLEVLPN